MSPPHCKKPAVDFDGLPAVERKANETAARRSVEGRIDVKGVACGNLREPVPNFEKAPCEKVISNSNNSWIVLGRDRPGGLTWGYGGEGHTQCGMIDLVVGRMHPSPKEERQEPDSDKKEKVRIDPIFTPYFDTATNEFICDSARIYISQKTNVDANFALVEGRVGDSKAKSAIAMKADAVRIVANEGIKLITNPDQINSHGCDIIDNGIDLIANNIDEWPDDLQPLAKGINLKDCLDDIIEHQEALTGILKGVIATMINFNSVLGTHVHHSPFFGIPTSQSVTVNPSAKTTNQRLNGTSITSCKNHLENLDTLRNTYLNVDLNGDPNPWYINSRYNNTN